MDAARIEVIPRKTSACMRGQLWIGLVSILGAVLCFATSAATQTPEPVAKQLPTMPQTVPPSGVRLESLPPYAPTVSYENGRLTISAYNSTLSDVLTGISIQTGADVDIPPEADERVAIRLGPGLPREVLNSLLAGSRFNYVIVGSAADPNALARVVLLPRPDNTDKLASANAPQPLVNRTGAVAQPRLSSQESTVIAEGVQPPDPQDLVLPVRSQQQMVQQYLQAVMEQFHNNQHPQQH